MNNAFAIDLFEQFLQTLERTKASHLKVNCKTREVFISPASKRILKFDPDYEVKVIEDFFSVFDDKSVIEIKNTLNDLIANNQQFALIQGRLEKFGNVIQIKVDLFEDDISGEKEILLCVEDMTKQLDLVDKFKSLEHFVKDQDLLSQALMSAINAHCLVSITNLRGEITYCNSKFCKTSGYSREELLGKNHNIVSSHIYSKKFWQFFWKKLVSGGVFQGPIQNMDKNGNHYWVETTIVPLKNQEGEIDKFISIRTDISNLWKTQKELEILRSSLGEKVEARTKELKDLQMQLIQSAKLASLGEMSSGLAHELNNPLFLIQGFNEQLIKMIKRKGNISYADASDFLSEIHTNTERILKLINHFRSFVRQDNLDRPLEKVNLKEVVDQSFHFYEEQFRTKDIFVEMNFPKEDLFVWGFDNRIEQVFVNFFSNTRDAFDENKDIKERKITVSFPPSSDENFIIARFEDNAGGMPLQNIERIFDPFFTTKEVGKGTGLGLSIVYNIIIKELHGKIDCFSRPGEGTTFQIKFLKWDSQEEKKVS